MFLKFLSITSDSLLVFASNCVLFNDSVSLIPLWILSFSNEGGEGVLALEAGVRSVILLGKMNKP